MKIKFTALLMFIALGSSAQSNYKILVKNEVGEIISNVLMTLFDGNQRIVYNEEANNSGYFSVNAIYPQDYYVILTAPGYRLSRKSLSSLSNELTNTLILDYEIVEVQQVNVVKDRPAVAIRGDTTFYKVEQKLGVETLKSLLRELPGMEVRQNGRVYFKGKVVSKIFIDGDDLFGSSYNMALDRIKSRIITQIEAIENHHEIELFKGIINSDEVVLNLNLASPEQQSSFQDLSVNLAIGGALGASYSRMDVGNIKALTVMGLNEYTPLKKHDELEHNVGLQNLEGFYHFKLGTWKDDERFHLKDRAFQISQNALNSIGKKMKLKTTYQLLKATEFDEANISKKYFSLNGAEIKEQRDLKHTELDSRINVHLFSKNTAERYLSFATSIAYSSAKNQENSKLMALDSKVEQIKKPMLLAFKFDYFIKLNANSILEVKNTLISEQVNEVSTWDEVDFSQQKLWSTTLENSLAYFHKQGSFENHFSINQQLSKAYISMLDSVALRRSHILWTFNYMPRFKFRKMLIEASISLRGRSIGEYNGQKWYNENLKVLPSYKIAYKWSPDIRNQFGISFAENYALYALEDINPSSIKFDFFSNIKGLGRDGFHNSQSFLTTYIHTNLYSQFSTQVSLLQIRRLNSLGTRYVLESNVLSLMKVVNPPLEMISFNVGISKFLGFTNGLLKYSFVQSKNQFIDFTQPNLYNRIAVHNQQHRLLYKSAYVGLINHFSSLEIEKNESSANNLSKVSSTLGLQLKLSDNLLVEIDNIRTVISTPNGNFKSADLRTTINSKIGNLMNLNIRFMNILNSREESQYVDSYLEQTLKQSYRLPRTLFLQLSYTIK